MLHAGVGDLTAAEETEDPAHSEGLRTPPPTPTAPPGRCTRRRCTSGVKFTSLLANLVIFHNTLDIADVVRQLQAEGWEIDPLDLAEISPYLTEHINRFGSSWA